MVRFDEVNAMKNKIKIMLLAFVLTVSMCVPAYAEVVEEYLGFSADEMKESSQQFYEQCIAATDEELDNVITSYENSDTPALAESYQGLKEVKSSITNAEYGDFVMETVEESDSNAALSMSLDLICESGTYQQIVVVDENFQIVRFNYELKEAASMGSLMAKAGMNTLMGMGIVFLVLILICFLISLFKYLPGSGYAKQKALELEKDKQKEIPAAPSPVNPAPSRIQPEDDTELIAVISAAVAAAMGTTTTDGFVVRSIKKRKW